MSAGSSQNDFGAHLRRLRSAQDYTQERLGEAVGCATETIRSFENGRRRPSLSIAQRIAEVLQIPPDDRAAFLRLARSPVAEQRGTSPVDQLPTTLSATTLPAIDRPTTALIGRRQELSRLRELILDERRRLITMLGPGGIGKTRLAIATATALADAFPDGSGFAALAPVSNAQHAITAVAAAVGCSLPGGRPPLETLLYFLRPRSLLLVIDNLEHLLGGSDGEQIGQALAQIVREAPGVHLLLTSRERIKLRDEYVFELEPLALPDNDLGAAIERSDAVLLFLERARQVSGAFALTPANRRAVAAICRMLDGIPLALELAASWTRVLSCDEIAAELHAGLDFLTQNDHDLPERHRSPRAVLDHSWRLLTDDEQRMLMRLAVFRGGCRREAVRAVAADTPAAQTLTLLAALVDKSLVRRTNESDGATRYDLHELVRQYAAARHAEDPADQATTAARHAGHYAELVAGVDEVLKSAAQKQALQTLDSEIANIRAAWQWACSAADHSLIGAMALTLDWYYELRGWHAEAVAAFAAGSAALTPTDAASIEQQRRYWVLVGREGWHRLRFDPAGAAEKQEQAVAHLRALDDPHALLRCLTGMAYLQTFAGAYAEAEALLAEAEQQALRTGDIWSRSVSSVVRGTLEVLRSDAATAQRHTQAALAAARVCGDPRHITHALSYLAMTALSLGQIAEAEGYCSEAVARAAEHQDRFQMALTLQLLGQVALERGDFAECAWLLDEGLALARAIDDRWLEAQALGHQGALAERQGDQPRARRLIRAAVTAAVAAPAPIALDLLAQLAAHLLADQPETALTLLTYLADHPLTRPATLRAVDEQRQALVHSLDAATQAGAAAAAATIPLERPAEAIRHVHGA